MAKADSLLVDEQLLMPPQLEDPLDTVNELSSTETPRSIESHSERLQYEEMQRLHKSKWKRSGGQLHPEREEYEQMQQNSRRKIGLPNGH